MAVKKDLRHTKRLAKTLRGFDKVLSKAAIFARGEILDLWKNGFGANSKKMKGLQEPYKTKKGETGRNPIRNLNYGGSLTQSMTTRKSGDGYVIGWQDPDQLDKARGNNKHAPNMMRVGDKLEKATIKLAEKLLWKEVNKA